ncbi:MAG: hypothetical protein ACO3QG_02315 [Candidatus Nanopelagicales bacterium]
MELFEGMSVKLTQVGGFTRSIGLLVGFGFLSIISILVAGSPKQQTGLALIFATISILVPGFLLMRALSAFTNDYLAEIVYGSAVITSLIILIHPILSRYDLGFLTLTLVLLIGVVSFVISYKKNLINEPKLVNIKQIFLFLPILIIVAVWLGRQAAAVPASNLDLSVVPPDIYHHMSLAAEITHHGGQIFPYVAGSQVDLIYHFGAFSLGSFLSFNGFFTLPIAMYRIEFILISLLFIFALFVMGKQIAMRNLGGFVAVIVGAFTLFPAFEVADGLRVATTRTLSISQLVGSALLVTGLGLALRVAQSKYASGATLFFIVLINAATTLSKGPTGAMLVGVLFVLAISQRLFENTWVSLKTFFASLIGFFIVFPFIFEIGSSGSNGVSLWINPLHTVRVVLGYQGIEINQTNLLIFSTVLFFSAISPAIIAVTFLNEKIYRARIIALGAGVIAGASGLMIFEAWGNSQWFVYYPIIPLVAALYAILAKIIFEKNAVYSPLLYLGLGLIGQPTLQTIFRRWLEPSQIAYNALWLVSVLILIFIGFLIALIYENTSKITALQMAAVTLAGVGLFSALSTNDIRPMPVGNYEHPWSTTIGTQAVGDWLRKNSSPDDVLVSNRHCVGPEENNPCHARIFALSALAERRVLIEGWSYTTCPLSEPLINSFWNDELFNLNQKVVLDPDAQSINEISRYGVKWVVIDRLRPAAQDFSDFASLEYQKGDMEVWKLNNPSEIVDLPNTAGCK